jgi:hypothetical protein
MLLSLSLSEHEYACALEKAGDDPKSSPWPTGTWRDHPSILVGLLCLAFLIPPMFRALRLGIQLFANLVGS